MKLSYPIVLDGGLSNILEAKGHDLNHKLWTAKLLEEAPEVLVQAHLDYLLAGAECIITSSYQASVLGLKEAGYSTEQAERLLLKTVLVAEEARTKFLTQKESTIRPLIAASIGPYGAYLADGSEYRGDYRITEAELVAFHAPRIALLDQTQVDLFACETIPSYQEAKALVQLFANTQKQAWFSFSCQDGAHLNDGTKIEAIVDLLKGQPNIFAIGVNCTPPQYISSLIQRIKKNLGDQKIVVYPNSGEVYNAHTKTWSNCSQPALFTQMAKEWLSLGVDMIGGCCRIGPACIQELKALKD